MADIGRWSAGPEVTSRKRLLDLSVGLVEDLRTQGSSPEKGPEAFSSDFKLCFPYRGLFVWHVGSDDVVGDANQVLFVTGGEAFRMSGPLGGSYGELVITPDPDVLSEIAHVNGQPLSRHVLFTRRAWPATPRLQSLRTRFLHWATSPSRKDSLEAQEHVLALLRSALQQDGRRETSNAATTVRLIRRAKEFLEAQMSNRVLLIDVARAAGTSPAYLTDLFTRVEGLSLHQYLTQLRLARALVELPHAADLTALALDLGFSSHSHFSFAFRRAFGCTPSEFRNTTRRTARTSSLVNAVTRVPQGGPGVRVAAEP